MPRTVRVPEDAAAADAAATLTHRRVAPAAPETRTEVVATRSFKRADGAAVPPAAAVATILAYVVIWIASLCAPATFLALGYQAFQVGGGWTAMLVAFTIAVAACYIPTDGVVCPPLRRLLGRFSTMYARQWRFSMEGSTTAPQDGPDAKPVMYGVHPHGVFCMGWGSIFAAPEFDGVTFCFADALFLSPFFRAFTSLIGRPTGVSMPYLSPLFKHRKNLALIPGGFEEASIHHMDHERAYLKYRTGWIKLALKHGYDVRAVYAFGERATYFNVPGLYDLRLKLNSFKLPAILPFGWWVCPILPKPDFELDVWMTARLELPHIPNPTKTEVAHWHGKYVDMLRDLHARRKGAGDPELEIW